MENQVFLVYEIVCSTINGPSKTLLFQFSLFRFSRFPSLIVKNLLKKPPNFIMNFESSYKVALYDKFLQSTNFRKGNDGPLNFFLNLHGNAFWLFVFSKSNKYQIFAFNGTFRMYRSVLHY